ncbi:MAG: AMP-binding protein [Alphaproteobacteria bacterium]|nr:AMP-binding protein [Alphaproteobacteria bacterium]
MAVWCYADLWESVAGAQPERPAIIQGERIIAWEAFNAEADALAAHLRKAGLGRHAKVGIHMHNAPEYLIAQFAAYKMSFAPFNANYRYGANELHYLFDNADAEAVIFDADLADRLEPIRERLPLVKSWIGVARPGAAVPPWAEDFAGVVAAKVAPNQQGPWGRSEDDLMMLYTGGTTGMPKGVMWRQGDLMGVGSYGANPLIGAEPLAKPEDAGPRAATSGLPRPVAMIGPPLMHGTGLMGAQAAFTFGGTVVLLAGRKFDPVELWDAVHAHRATRISIVGLPFATPMLDALDTNPGRWDVSSVRMIGSSGAMWSKENKAGLLRHMPQVQLMDAFASSEALGLGVSTSAAAAAETTARFVAGPNTAVFDEDWQRVAPGSGKRGMVALSGFLPLGYYKDPEKTARTFPTIEGQRWSVPGDWAEVNEDGSLKLLGRGSQSINTGGEKVFPEEVEEALKRHAAIRDAAVVGVPDARFGEKICAVVEPRPGFGTPELPDLAAFVKTQLADYKAPRALVVVESIGRSPNGKMDYPAVKRLALERTQAL